MAGVPVPVAVPLEGNHQAPVVLLPWMRYVCQTHAISLLVAVHMHLADFKWPESVVVQQSKLQLPCAVHQA